jgi:hypothetical protein
VAQALAVPEEQVVAVLVERLVLLALLEPEQQAVVVEAAEIQPQQEMAVLVLSFSNAISKVNDE